MNAVNGPDDDVPIPKTSMGSYLLDCLKTRASTDIIYEDAISNETLSAQQLLEESIKIMSVFKSFGLEQNDVVCLISENSVNYFSVILAGLYMGVVINPLNPEYTAGELQHAFQITQPKLIVGSEEVVAVLSDSNTCDCKIILLTPSSKENCDLPNLQQLVQDMHVETESYQPQDFDYSEQLGLILLSSGTTGLPKGVAYTHQNIRATGTIIKTLHLNTKSNCLLHFLPSFHVYGIMLLLSAIVNQTKVVIIRKFTTEVFFKSIETHQVETVFAVPRILQILANTKALLKYNVTSIKYVYTGSDSVSSDIIHLLSQRLDNVSVLQLYGLTETSGPCVYQKLSNIKLNSVGSLMPGCTAIVRCLKTHKPLGPYKVGEICFGGHFVMKAYFNNEEDTKASVDDDGFLHTGDLGYYDEDGCFFIVDRLKHIIKYKGFQVSPNELENVIMLHPSVKDCGVVGLPDEAVGELPLAFVVLRQGELVQEEEIVNYVAERISVQKRLYGGVRFVESIPKTSTGKIKRQILKCWCKP